MLLAPAITAPSTDICYYVSKNQSLVPDLNHMNPIHALTPLSIRWNSILSSIYACISQAVSFLKLCMHFSFAIFVHLPTIPLSICRVSGVEYRSISMLLKHILEYINKIQQYATVCRYLFTA